MTDLILPPITIPLSAHHQKRFAEIRAQEAQLTSLLNEIAGAIVGVTHDPAELARTGHTVQLSPDGTALLVIPPVPTKPALVPDIGADGVSEAAATA